MVSEKEVEKEVEKEGGKEGEKGEKKGGRLKVAVKANTTKVEEDNVVAVTKKKTPRTIFEIALRELQAKEVVARRELREREATLRKIADEEEIATATAIANGTLTTTDTAKMERKIERENRKEQHLGEDSSEPRSDAWLMEHSSGEATKKIAGIVLGKYSARVQ